MVTIKNSINNITLFKKSKIIKLFHEILILKNLLKNSKFILFFVYDFFDSFERIKLNTYLYSIGLSSKIFSNKTLKLSLNFYNNLNLFNLLNNEILFIYSKNNKIINKVIIKKLLKIKKLIFLNFYETKNYIILMILLNILILIIILFILIY